MEWGGDCYFLSRESSPLIPFAYFSHHELTTFALALQNLAMYGTDFESIARVMPGRTRHEVKNKFNSEDRKNPELINEYLFQPKPIGEFSLSSPSSISSYPCLLSGISP